MGIHDRVGAAMGLPVCAIRVHELKYLDTGDGRGGRARGDEAGGMGHTNAAGPENDRDRQDKLEFPYKH